MSSYDFLNQLSEIKLGYIKDAPGREALGELAVLFFETKHRLRDKVYATISDSLSCTWGAGRHIFGPFKPMADAFSKFYAAENRDARLSAALAFCEAYENIQSEFCLQAKGQENKTDIGYGLGWKELKRDWFNIHGVIKDVSYFRTQGESKSADALIRTAWMVGGGDSEELWRLCGESLALQLAATWWTGLPACSEAKRTASDKKKNKEGLDTELRQKIKTLFAESRKQQSEEILLDRLGDKLHKFMERYGADIASNQCCEFTFDDFVRALSDAVRLAESQGQKSKMASMQKIMSQWLYDKPLWRKKKAEYSVNPDWFAEIGSQQNSIRFVLGVDAKTRDVSNALFPREVRKTFLLQQGFFKEAEPQAAGVALRGLFGEGPPDTFQKLLEHEKHLTGEVRASYFATYVESHFKGSLGCADDLALLNKLIQPRIEQGRESEKFWGSAFSQSYYRFDDYDSWDSVFKHIKRRIPKTSSVKTFVEDFNGLTIENQSAVVAAMEHFDMWPDALYRGLITEKFLKNLSAIQSDVERQSLIEKLLFGNPVKTGNQSSSRRIGLRYLNLCNGLIDVWTQAVVSQYGLDDGSEQYASTLEGVIKPIMTRATARNRDTMLDSLCDAVLAQVKVCQFVQDQLDLTSNDFYSANLPVDGAELISKAAANSKELRESLIDYLSQPLSDDACGSLAKLLKEESDRSVGVITQNGRIELGVALEDYHSYFQAMPTERQAVVLDHLLMPGSVVVDDKEAQKAYIEITSFVEDRLFPPDMEHSGLVRDYFRAHVAATPRYMQSVLLAAMLATRNQEVEGTTIGHRFATLLEFLGSAYVKLGQGIHSCPYDLADDFRDPLERLKARAQKRSRVDVVLQAQRVLPAFISKTARYGEILGSASFNTAIETDFVLAGKNICSVLLTQSDHAQQGAINGFRCMEDALKACVHTFWEEHRDIAVDLVGEARDMSIIETDPRYSQPQSVNAYQAYAGLDTSVSFPSGQTFDITYSPASMYGWGDTHRLIEKKHGVLFNSTGLSEDPMARKAVALSYVTVELIRILSGKCFDVDRHGAQMRIERTGPETYHAGLFDFGGMGLEEPTEKEKGMLARAVVSIADAFASKGNPVQALNDFVKTENGEGISGVKRARKALLALQDFMKELDQKDISACLLSVCQSPEVDPLFKDVLIQESVARLGPQEIFKGARLLTSLPFVGENIGKIALSVATMFNLNDPLPNITITRQPVASRPELLYAPNGNGLDPQIQYAL